MLIEIFCGAATFPHFTNVDQLRSNLSASLLDSVWCVCIKLVMAAWTCPPHQRGPAQVRKKASERITCGDDVAGVLEYRVPVAVVERGLHASLKQESSCDLRDPATLKYHAFGNVLG